MRPPREHRCVSSLVQALESHAPCPTPRGLQLPGRTRVCACVPAADRQTPGRADALTCKCQLPAPDFVHPTPACNEYRCCPCMRLGCVHTRTFSVENEVLMKDGARQWPQLTNEFWTKRAYTGGLNDLMTSDFESWACFQGHPCLETLNTSVSLVFQLFFTRMLLSCSGPLASAVLLLSVVFSAHVVWVFSGLSRSSFSADIYLALSPF